MANQSKILWVAAADPWSEWTLSGVSLGICSELQRRGLLYGAISPNALTTRHLQGTRAFYKLERKLLEKVARSRAANAWRCESRGIVGRVLRNCPDGTAVIYALLTPEIDERLSVRRFRWMDLSTRDAIETRSFGHARLNRDEIERKYQDQRRMISACHGVVALSTYCADRIAGDLNYPRELITPIGAGPAVRIEAGEFTRERYRAARVLFVGRDWDRKGGQLVLEAFRRVKESIPHATLTIVGPEAAPAKDEGIIFVGPLDKGSKRQLARLKELFQRASVFCMASSAEPWGLVYVEAAQCGVPIVAFKDWALPDIVVDGATGRLVADRTSKALASGMLDILSAPERAAQMGAAAAERVRDVLDWPHVVDRLLDAVMPSALAGREAKTMQ